MNRPYIGAMHRKIPVSSEGNSAYFGKRSDPTLGSRHQGSTLAAYFRDTTLAFPMKRTKILIMGAAGKGYR
jgi:hypothetical protein